MDAFGRLGSLEGYAGLLGLLEAFHVALEGALAPWVEAAATPAELQSGWRRAGLLRADLRRLGRAPSRPVRAAAPPASRDEALGAWYVLEGSRLGGHLIAREARRRLPVAGPALGALEGALAPGRWPAFRRWLDGPGGVRDADAATAGALAAFAAFDAGLERAA